MEVQVKIERGPQGIGECRLLKNNIKIIAEDGSVYEISYEKVDEDVVLNEGKNLSFSISKNKDTLYNLRPAEGTMFAKFGGFLVRRNEEIPKPELKKGGPRKKRNGESYFAPDRIQFMFFHEIVNGKWKGTKYLQAYDYSFGELDNGNTSIVVRGARTQRMEKWLRIASDGLDIDIPYSDNILPDLQKILFDKDVIYQIQVENGWVQNVMELPEGITPDMITKEE